MTSNVIDDVESIKSKKLKTMNLRKARKWWDDQSNKLKLLQTIIVTNTMNLAPKKTDELKQFILQCILAERDGSVLNMPSP